MKKMLTMATVGLLMTMNVASASVQVGFSPEGSARALVLEVINNASKSIDLIGYAFQSPDIVHALVAAQKRGVEVRCVIDYKRNQNKTSRSVIEYARENNVQVRLSKHYPIQHDKTMIIDGNTVETGSFNFARSAEFENSENVLIIRDEPAIVAAYQSHFTSRWNLGK
ncbi:MULTISPECIES: phospholipase D family protein [unclassified Symbiopectobacterium]|uniref:phospholipase D family nuclease n=1 Tax=unclassified Symbiopectobacterium TaxID=2794573 RepID=UPI0022271838|nr:MULTISPECIES: phospholipase D family protein [unclassified Symbiopectobacterium]MCW2473376.1 phospholipase D family protein [Candidatus Symbiopectobacterium sp. NZEC151]MCW2481947.1 phospholipase D family protein [Candidatus Symbiopectobacterium sp. NZEC135]MCW2484529.1 phospholipase D family protein [Candidatus Symbiopectobacterium sp. NZEC127]